jgi:hypothetical protein
MKQKSLLIERHTYPSCKEGISTSPYQNIRFLETLSWQILV